jgi:mRNA-degrading endonuclease toxin of MazEF toxin-antitoxin module
MSNDGLPLAPEPMAAPTETAELVRVGDVWWIPDDMSGYPGGKGRFCLVVALEKSSGSVLPVRAHYVAGSTQKGSRPQIVLEPGDAGLDKRSYFSFWWSGDLSVTALATVGRFKGRLDAARLDEIKAAICASRKVALKKLVAS